jgi:tyrosyl-tRNA synthetase
MRLPDELIVRYARLAAFWPTAEIAALEADLASHRLNPIDAKKRVAESIVGRYHGTGAAAGARERFERTVQRRELPDEMPTLHVERGRKLPDLLVAAGFAESKRAAERLIHQGGVRIDGEPVSDTGATVDGNSFVLSVGARRFVRVTPA